MTENERLPALSLADRLRVLAALTGTPQALREALWLAIDTLSRGSGAPAIRRPRTSTRGTE